MFGDGPVTEECPGDSPDPPPAPDPCTGGSVCEPDPCEEIGEGCEPGEDPTPVQQLANLLLNNPYALLDVIDCDALRQWEGVATHAPPESVMEKLEDLQENHRSWWERNVEQTDWRVQELEDARGAVVNMDYFSVTVQLPEGMSAAGLFDHVRRNLNDFVDTDISRFDYYPDLPDERERWLSNDPLSAIFSIKIYLSRGGWGPRDDGSVIVSGYSPSNWTFTTIETPADWTHPVSGNREFGYWQSGKDSYTFYTRGVDRVTDLVDSWVQSGGNLRDFDPAFDGGDALWDSFLESIREYVEDGGGKATINGNEGHRVDWNELEDVLTGETPVSSYEGCDLGGSRPRPRVQNNPFLVRR